MFTNESARRDSSAGVDRCGGTSRGCDRGEAWIPSPESIGAGREVPREGVERVGATDRDGDGDGDGEDSVGSTRGFGDGERGESLGVSFVLAGDGASFALAEGGDISGGLIFPLALRGDCLLGGIVRPRRDGVTLFGSGSTR